MNLVNGILYSTTSQNCNGVRSGVYAIDLSNADRKFSYFEAAPAELESGGAAGQLSPRTGA